MPIYCAALGCRNTNDVKRKTVVQMELEKSVKVTFHVFPSNPARREQWMKIMKLENKHIAKRSFLCSLHFEEKFMDRTSLVYVRLRENAIPNLLEDTSCDKMEDEIDSIYDKGTNTSSRLLCNEIKKETDSIYDKGTNTSPSLLKQNTRKPETRDKETRISPERTWKCPIIQTIQETTCIEIGSLEKQIKVLQQKIRRKEQKIAIMKSILNELKIKNFISDKTK